MHKFSNKELAGAEQKKNYRNQYDGALNKALPINYEPK